MFFLVISVFAINVLRGNPAIDSLLFSIALAVGLTPQLPKFSPKKAPVDVARSGQGWL
jgi:hypothetical protein